MDTTTQQPPTDYSAIVRQLDTSSIRTRLDEIDRERAALLVLLRASMRAKPRAAHGRREVPA